MARRHVVWACCALGCSKEAPAPIYADLAGARSLVLFGADVRRDVTLEAGLLAKTLEDGTLDHVFPEEGWFAPPDNFPQGPIYVVSLEVSVSGLALISLGSPVWFTEYGAEATDGELAPGVWCQALVFDTSVAGDAPLTCVDPTADPNPLRCQEDQPCPAMSQPYLADLQPDGRVWALWAAEGGVELWTFDRETGVLATPLPVQADRLFVDAGGASIEVDGSIEHYELAGDAASLVRLTGTTFRMVGERILKWGGRPVVWDGSGWGLLDHAEDRIIPSSEVLVADTCAPSPGDAMATDGSVVYVQDFDGLDCRCTATACTPVSESEDAALADVYQSTWESDGVTLYVRSDDGLWFLREGVISDNLASTITVREVLVLGGQLHFTGVDANNVGGLFRVDFDGAAFSFTRVEDYGSTVVELVQVSAG